MKKSKEIFPSGMLFLIIFTVIHIVHAENALTELKDKITHHNPNTTNEVTIYTESNYWGPRWTMTVTGCVDVPALYYKKASSIDTHDNCVILFGRHECRGRHVRIAPGTDGHSHLSEVNFDDTLASMKSCDEESNDQKSSSKKRDRRNVKIFSQFIGNLGMAQPGNGGGGGGVDMSRLQNGGSSFQTLFQTLNLNNLMNQLHVRPNDNGDPNIMGLPSLIPKK